MRLAQERQFDEVLAQFRSSPPDEVLAVADWLREEDIYNVAIELYTWLLDVDQSAAAQFGMGQCYGKIYEYDKALDHLDLAFARIRSAAREPATTPTSSSATSAWMTRIAGIAKRWRARSEKTCGHARTTRGSWRSGEDGRRRCAAYEDVLERNPAYTWAVKRYAMLLLAIGERDRARR